MSTHKLLFCLGIAFLFEATAPVSATTALSSAASELAITDAKATPTTTMRPKKKAKKAKKRKKRGGKKGCEAFTS